MGLAFDCQILPEVPTDAHDQAVDYVCCADGLIRTGAAAGEGGEGEGAGSGSR